MTSLKITSFKLQESDEHKKKLEQYYINKCKTEHISQIISKKSDNLLYKNNNSHNNKTSQSEPAKKLSQIATQSSLIKNLTQKLLPHVPKSMQPHVKVACFIDGILTIHLSSSTWSHQFRYLKLELISQLRKYPDFFALSEIKHSISAAHQPILRKPLKNNIQLSEGTISYIRLIMKTTDNPKMKESLHKLLKNLLLDSPK